MSTRLLALQVLGRGQKPQSATMSDRSTKIILYKANQRNLFKNEAVTATATDDYKEHDVTLTDTSAMMLDNNVENTEIEKQQKKFQV